VEANSVSSVISLTWEDKKQKVRLKQNEIKFDTKIDPPLIADIQQQYILGQRFIIETFCFE
jgi:hypothetical protein